MKKIILFLALCFSITYSFGQRALNQELKLVDGLYLNINEFKKDAPSRLWKEYEVVWTYNTKLKCYQVENIHKKGHPGSGIQDSVWGFTLKGIPYIRISPDSSGRPLTLFAELTVRGLINIFSYEKEHQELTEYLNQFGGAKTLAFYSRDDIKSLLKKMFPITAEDKVEK